MGLEKVIDLNNAANYLDIPDLVNLVSARIASELINCIIKEARAEFGIVCDMSEEEKKK